MTCPVCALEVTSLVVDAPGTPQEALMCVRCQRCTEIMASDVNYLVDPRYNLLGLGESQVSYMRRMHEVLL